MVWLQNDRLLGFLFKSIVSLWASSGLLFAEHHLKPVLLLFFTFTATLLWKPIQKPVVFKLWLKYKCVGPKIMDSWASYSNPLFHSWASNGLPFVEDRLKSVLAPFLKLTVILLWKPVEKPMVFKLWLKYKWFGSKMTGFWASYSDLLFHFGLPTGFSLWKTIRSPCSFIFHLYSNSFEKVHPEARGIKAMKKQMVWLHNNGLLGFLFKSIV